jgi:hypothetical protein
MIWFTVYQREKCPLLGGAGKINKKQPPKLVVIRRENFFAMAQQIIR